MFLENLNNTPLGKAIAKGSKNELTFANSYLYHKNNLFQKCIRLFEWEYDETVVPFNQKQIELPLLTGGYGLFSKINEKPIAGYGSLYNQNKYFYYEYDNCLINTPNGSYRRSLLNKEAVLVNNNSLRQSIMPMIERYATLIAHTEITFVMSLVNGRASRIFTTTDPSTAESVNQFLNDLYIGKMNSITDDLMQSVNVLDFGDDVSKNYKDLCDTIKFLYEDFFRNMGIKSESSKRERLNLAEVAEDSGLTTLMIDDMYKCRLDGAKALSEFYGTEFRVKPLVSYEDIEVSETEDDSPNGENGEEGESYDNTTDVE